jgi:hypothetical protein
LKQPALQYCHPQRHLFAVERLIGEKLQQ